jgi:uncharacterized damage-inducible protein DinB
MWLLNYISPRESTKMKVLSLVIVAVFAYALGIGAQSPANPVSDAIRAGWNTAKRNMLASAKVMPADKYGFKPVDTVRTFGQILAHVAGANYAICAGAKGEKSPHTEEEFEKSATTAAAITKALQDSVAYCDTAYSALTDATAGQVPSGMKGSRAGILLGNTRHNDEHYGNLVTYLRINGLVPPSSAPSR